MPNVFVSGCFDMLHSGHIAFLEEAASHGDLYVGVARDQTISLLKGRAPFNSENERLYMIKALRAVKDAWVCTGLGMMEFEEDVRRFRPDIFFVNNDGITLEKEALCKELGMELVVSTRQPHVGLPARSTTSFLQECHIPYRVDIAGAWLDQPVFSKIAPGPVLTISIEPTMEFVDRSGMASSTRKKAIELWGTRFPVWEPMKIGQTLFCFENQPGNPTVSGSQDSLGMALPGFNKLHYNGDFWPEDIASCNDDTVLNWLEKHVYLIFIKQRAPGYDPYLNCDITPEKVRALADAAERAWHAALACEFDQFGAAFLDSFTAQSAILPAIVTPETEKAIAAYKNRIAGWKLLGAGGGGYMAVVAKERADGMIPLKIRRSFA